MNMQRWVVASIVVTLVVAILEMIIHGVALQPLYQQTAAVWRPQAEAQTLMPLMWLGYAIFAPFFVWIYAQGLDPKKDAIGQGVRFGLMLGIGLSAMSSFIWYVVLPIPQTLAVAWFLAGVVVYIAAGMAVAMAYPVQATRQPKTKAKRRR
jgi:MFS family permease